MKRRSRRARIVVIVSSALLIAVGAGIGIAVPFGMHWDFANFYDAGQKAWVGTFEDLYDPTAPIPGRRPLGGMTYLGTPIASLLYAPLATLPPGVALVAFKLWNTLALLAALVVLVRFNRRFAGDDADDRLAYLAWLAPLTLLYQPFWTVYWVGGQTTSTVLLLLTAGMVFHTRRRGWLAAACLIAAVLLKPFLAPMLALLALLSGRRFLVATALLASGVIVLSIAGFGWGIHREFLGRLLAEAGVSIAWVHNSSLYVWIESLRLQANPESEALSRPAGLTIAIRGLQLLVAGLVVRLLFFTRAILTQPAARLHSAFVLSLLLALLVSPIVWEHYLALLFIVLAYLLAARRHLSAAGARLIGAAFVLALGQNIVLARWLHAHAGIDTVPEHLLMGLLKSGPLIAITLFLGFRRGDLLATYRAPAWREL